MNSLIRLLFLVLMVFIANSWCPTAFAEEQCILSKFHREIDFGAPPPEKVFRDARDWPFLGGIDNNRTFYVLTSDTDSKVYSIDLNSGEKKHLVTCPKGKVYSRLKSGVFLCKKETPDNYLTMAFLDPEHGELPFLEFKNVSDSNFEFSRDGRFGILDESKSPNQNLLKIDFKTRTTVPLTSDEKLKSCNSKVSFDPDNRTILRLRKCLYTKEKLNLRYLEVFKEGQTAPTVYEFPFDEHCFQDAYRFDPHSGTVLYSCGQIIYQLSQKQEDAKIIYNGNNKPLQIQLIGHGYAIFEKPGCELELFQIERGLLGSLKNCSSLCGSEYSTFKHIPIFDPSNPQPFKIETAFGYTALNLKTKTCEKLTKDTSKLKKEYVEQRIESFGVNFDFTNISPDRPIASEQKTRKIQLRYWKNYLNKTVTLVFDRTEYCTPDQLHLNPTQIESPCTIKPIDWNAPLTKNITNLIRQLSSETTKLAELGCFEPFDPEKWNPRTPFPPHIPLSKEVAYEYLLRFQKPKGLDAKLHREIIEALTQSNWLKQEPGLVYGMLQTLLVDSPELFKSLIEKNKKLLTLNHKKLHTIVNECRTPEELAEIQKATLEYLSERDHANENTRDNRDKWLDLTALEILKPVLSSLSEEAKEDWADKIAQSRADRMADSDEFSGIFLSKLYKFQMELIKPYFGLPAHENFTDIALIRDAYALTPKILGLKPIQEDPKTMTQYGIAISSLPTIYIPQNKTNLFKRIENLSWRQENKTFQTKLTIERKISKSDQVVPIGDGPRYDQIFHDKKLVGVIIAGANLGNIQAQEVLSEYEKYFKRQGFEEQTSKQPFPAVHSFLKKMIASGVADYLIKEAHSDGDENNIMLLQNEGIVTILKKKNQSGIEEIVYLVGLSEGPVSSDKISNHDFGDWIRTRAENRKGQFVYFNTSCWSVTKALHEVEAARSTTLLDIPTLTTTATFADDPKNAEFHLLTAFREGKNFAEMRKGLKNTPTYASGLEDHFIFPDDWQYSQKITQVLERPLEIKISPVEEVSTP